MRQKVKFNRDRDLQPVVEGLAMDLDKAIETGEVLPTATAEEYNMVESLEEVGELVRDNFEAMDAGNALAYQNEVSTPTGESE